MISKNNALKRLLSLSKPMSVELIKAENCLERILAQDLTAKSTAPPSDVSAMDGYAIVSNDKIRERELKVVGE